MERPATEPVRNAPPPGFTRRDALRAGLLGLAALAGGGAAAYAVRRAAAKARFNPGSPAGLDACSDTDIASAATEPAGGQGATGAHPRGNPTEFRNDAPRGEIWELWQKRGWAREGSHYEKSGRDVLCQLCPNECLLEPESRGRCRNRVNKGGTLYTLAYGNPCAFHVDPIEKKPLFHFRPGTRAFSIATPGCSFRCLNCQNWEISQFKPEQLKDPHGDEVRLDAAHPRRLGQEDLAKLSMFPDDVVALAEATGSGSVAYTYSEPNAFYEYMYDTAQKARARGIANCWITNGYLREPALLNYCLYLDAANVNLKTFNEKTYRALNAGKLQPILDTLQTLKKQGVWFEVTNLVIPTYTDDMEETRRMCGWLVDHLGPDQPLHLLRFRPLYKLTHLPPTPTQMLLEAREVARAAGLRYVYIGNAQEIEDAETTFCPHCRKAVVEREYMSVSRMELKDGRCRFCETKVAGVWTVPKQPVG